MEGFQNSPVFQNKRKTSDQLFHIYTYIIIFVYVFLYMIIICFRVFHIHALLYYFISYFKLKYQTQYQTCIVGPWTEYGFTSFKTIWKARSIYTCSRYMSCCTSAPGSLYIYLCTILMYDRCQILFFYAVCPLHGLTDPCMIYKQTNKQTSAPGFIILGVFTPHPHSRSNDSLLVHSSLPLDILSTPKVGWHSRSEAYYNQFLICCDHGKLLLLIFRP